MIKKIVSVIIVLTAIAPYKIIGMDTPLHKAILRGDEAECNRMLEEGASPDATTSNGLTALHLAVRAGKVTIVNLILAKHPDLSLRNKAGLTALDDALQIGNQDVINAIAGYNVVRSKSIFERTIDTIAHLVEFDIQTEPIDDSSSAFARISTGPQ